MLFRSRTNGETATNGDREYVSFEDSFDSEIRNEFGDLGPEPVGGGDRGGERDRSSGDRGRGGGRSSGGRGRSGGGGRGRGRRD